MLKIKTTFRFITKCSILLVILFSQISTTYAALNFGNLDVKLIDNQEQIKVNLKGGDTTEQKIRISNFSTETKNLRIFATDAKKDNNNNFIIKEENELSEDIYNWIKLPTNDLELKAGETKIITALITAPTQAGFGLHTGAIMVKEKISNNQNNIQVEKGIRIYANIIGKIRPSVKFQNSSNNNSNQYLNHSSTVINNGNTDLNGEISFNLLDHDKQTINQQTEKIYLKPGQIKEINLHLLKPSFGQFSTNITHNLLNQKETINLTDTFYFPTNIVYLLLLISILIIAKPAYSIIKTKKINFFLLFQTHRLAFAKSTAFLLIFGISISLIGSIYCLDNKNLLADSLSTINSKAYLTTIKWGNLDNKNLSDKYRVNWAGNIEVKNGKLEIIDKLHLESNDYLQINQEQNTLSFENSTGPDNDGVILKITSESSEPPLLIYKNNNSKENFEIPITNTINSTNYFSYQAHAISFSSLIIEDTNTSKETDLLKEEASSENVNLTIQESEASPTENIINEFNEEIRILQSIITDLPSSPNSLGQYIFKSNYVQEIQADNESSMIKAKPTLIDTLKLTPNTIKDITSSPNLNFVFLPDNKITFSPLQFSFNESKTSTQSIGELVFVQNKNTPWNTYITISDLTSVSGKNHIPLSAIHINPGKINMIQPELNDNSIIPGAETQLSNGNSQTTLVTVTPQNDQEMIFTMQPSLSITVPPGTPPGLYKANISIKII